MNIQAKSIQVAKIGPTWLFRKLSNRQFLMVGAIIVGLWAGLTAVLLKVSVHYLLESLASVAQDHPWIYFVSPTVGILFTYLFIRFLLNGDLAKGTSHVLLAIAKKSSFLPRKEVYAHVATSVMTVGMGGSAGLESPIVQTGSAIGATFASFFPVGYRDRTLLLACGAAAGIATAFNAPIAGVLFALEVLLVDISITAFVPLLIAGATGALCSKIILNEAILLSFKNLSDFDYHNLPYYILLGAACGLISVYYIRVTIRSDRFFKKVFKNDLARLLVGGALLGSLIYTFPALLGEGYVAIKSMALINPERLFLGSPLEGFFTQTQWVLALAILLIGFVKVFAVSFTLNAGGNGGNFAPSLFVGACLGFSFALLINLSGLTFLPPSHFCLVAMAGVLTGIFHSPLTAIFLIAEITGGYELIIPLMIVSALSTAMSRYMTDSLDDAKLKEGAVSISIDKDAHVLSGLTLAGFIEKDFVSVRLHTDLRTLVEAVARSKRNIFPVLDLEDKLVGIITLEDIREIMFQTDLYDTTLVNQLMRKPVVTAELNEGMGSVMEKFDKTGVWNIPVLHEDKYVGFISKSRIFSNYRDRLKNE
ncbi:MAG: chloride channel protein [Cytophagales bacterium]|nr:chloride channel protein [Cytophagales bacterium]